MGQELVYRSDGVLRYSEGTMCTAEEGKTRQEFKAESDINTLMKRGEAAIVPRLREEGAFIDVSEIGDLHECMEKVRRAAEAFALLPPHVRIEFDNEPALFTAAFDTPEGIAKLRELKVVADPPEVVADRIEAAAEERAAQRVIRREREARVAKAKLPPSGVP